MDFGTLVQLLNQVAPGLGDAAAQTLGPQEQHVLLQIFQDAESQQPGTGVQAVAQALMDAVQNAGTHQAAQAMTGNAPPGQGGAPGGIMPGGDGGPGTSGGAPPGAPPWPGGALPVIACAAWWVPVCCTASMSACATACTPLPGCWLSASWKICRRTCCSCGPSVCAAASPRPGAT